MTNLCRVCNQPFVIVKEPSTTMRFNDTMRIRSTTRMRAVHGEGESVKTRASYVRELRVRLEDSCRANAEAVA